MGGEKGNECNYLLNKWNNFMGNIHMNEILVMVFSSILPTGLMGGRVDELCSCERR